VLIDLTYHLRQTYLVIPALVNLIFCANIALRYSLTDILAGSIGSVLISLAVSPAPVGVAEADTTPALRRALYKLVILLMGADEGIEAG
jgi:hypothetical protein